MKKYLSASGCYRLLQIMTGDIPEIKKFGIISAEGPNNRTTSQIGNENNNLQLIEHLKSGNYPFIQIKGKNGNMGNPFLVLNISDHQMKELTIRFRQKVFISAKVNKNKGIEFILMNFKCEPENKAEIVYMPENPKCSYFVFTGEEFCIPFFDLNWNKNSGNNECIKDPSYSGAKEITKEYLAGLKSSYIKNPESGKLVKVSSALKSDKDSDVFKAAVEYIKRHVNQLKGNNESADDGYQSAYAINEYGKLNQLRLFNTEEMVISSNLFNPNRISYSVRELIIIKSIVYDIYAINEVNRKYNENKSDDYEFDCFAKWSRRGIILNLFKEIQKKILELN